MWAFLSNGHSCSVVNVSLLLCCQITTRKIYIPGLSCIYLFARTLRKQHLPDSLITRGNIARQNSMQHFLDSLITRTNLARQNSRSICQTRSLLAKHTRRAHYLHKYSEANIIFLKIEVWQMCRLWWVSCHGIQQLWGCIKPKLFMYKSTYFTHTK